MLSLIRRTPASTWRLCVSLPVMCFLLFACGGNTRAPVEDRHPPKTTHHHPVETVQRDSTYRVQRGDTLYSIAFRYGMDFRKLAAANGISTPYTIYPGQTIVMREVAISQPVPIAKTKDSAAAESPPVAKAPASSTAAPPPAPAPRSEPKKTAPAPTYSGAAVSKWLWPAEGRVTRGYSASVHKGIDISGKRGDPIVAVASGKVVYAGSGIVGFGELLIIKHNDVYLSAYGHNDRLLVAEGAVVAAGQKIAEKGSTGTNSVKLHFEIRKAGKPVDPQRLLPRR